MSHRLIITTERSPNTNVSTTRGDTRRTIMLPCDCYKQRRDEIRELLGRTMKADVGVDW